MKEVGNSRVLRTIPLAESVPEVETLMKTNLRTMLFLVGVTLIVSNPCVLAHTDVTAEQARDLIYSTPDLIVVDVREPYEYCDTTGHIPGALTTLGIQEY